MKKVAVVLAGCGNMDGAEIHESVVTLLALSRAGAAYHCFAPDVPVKAVKNYLTGKPDNEKRNVLKEAARIARGKIRDVNELKAADFDALIFPGGFGAASNFSTWPEKGAQGSVIPEIERPIREFFEARKPLGFVCIAPVLAALVLGKNGIELTIGNDAATAAGIEKTGARHINKAVGESHTDKKYRIVSTPAYMLGPSIADIAPGIESLVREVLRMTE